jgi:hypothetical protein
VRIIAPWTSILVYPNNPFLQSLVKIQSHLPIFRNNSTSLVRNSLQKNINQIRHIIAIPISIDNMGRSKRKTSPVPCSSPLASRPKTGPELFARDNEDDLKLAIDFGTTFTIVAVCKPKEAGFGGRPDFHVIRGYPFDPTPNPADLEKGVPSESYYPPNSIAPDRENKTKDSLENVSDHSSDLPTLIAQTIRPGYLWGNEIDKELRAARTAEYEQIRKHRIQGMKLMLDTRKVTKKWRHKTKTVIRTLQTHNDKIFNQELDVICDFLTAVLIHARIELERNYWLHASSQVEYIFTIPPSFQGRSLETAFMEALKRSGLPVAPATCRHKTFVVNEAEASASYVVHDQQIQVYSSIGRGGVALTCIAWGDIHHYGFRGWNRRYRHIQSGSWESFEN